MSTATLNNSEQDVVLLTGSTQTVLEETTQQAAYLAVISDEAEQSNSDTVSSDASESQMQTETETVLSVGSAADSETETESALTAGSDDSSNEVITTRFVVTSGNTVTLTSGGTYTVTDDDPPGCAGEVQMGGTLIGDNVTFAGNTSHTSAWKDGNGGAICNEGIISLSHATFSNNVCDAAAGLFDSFGGAIYNASYGKVTLSDVVFSGNTAKDEGGAIYNASNCTVTLSDVVFSGNRAGDRGGAFCNYGIANLTGAVTLSTSTDTFYNYGSVKWDLTGGTSTGCLNGYRYFINCSGSLDIAVNNEQEIGAYTIATGVTDVDGKNQFTLTGATATASITVGAGNVEYGGRWYSIGKVDDTLVLYAGTPRDLTGDSNISPMYAGGVTFSAYGSTVSQAKLGDIVTLSAAAVENFEVAGYTSDDVTISGGKFTMPDQDVTVKAQYRFNVADGKTLDLVSGTYTNELVYEGSGAAGEVQAGGTLICSSITFAGNTATGTAGAVENNGTVKLTGSVTLSTSTDTFCNNNGGIVNWDLTGDTTTGCLNGYQYFTNNSGSLYITVNNEQEIGAYTIATGVTDVDGKDQFTLTGATGTASITVDAGNVEYGGRWYSIGKVDDTLVLYAGTLRDLTDGGSNIQTMYMYAGGVTFSAYGSTVSQAKLGDIVTLSAAAVENFEIAGYTSDDVTISGGKFTMPDKDVTVKAQYRFNVQNGKTLDLVSGTYTNESLYAGNGAAGEVQEGGTLTSTGSVTFSSNTATGNGGAICNDGTATVIGMATFTGNKATNGGALCNNGTATVIGIAAFSDNTATNGGALYNDGTGTVSLSSATFSSNTATNGGALYNDGTVTIISEASFSNNTVSEKGGALYNNGTMSIKDGATFSGNVTGTSSGETITFGGAIYNEGTMSINGAAVFIGNTVGSFIIASGGAINNSGTISLSEATFSNNTASTYGGAIYNEGTMSINGAAIFSGNRGGSGGAIYNGKLDGRSGTVSLSSATFSGNTATRYDFGVLFVGVGGDGGAIDNDGGTVTVSDDAVFIQNVAGGTQHGGGAIYNAGTGTVSLSSATFSGNTANVSGGAIYNESGMISLSGATFSGNVATDTKSGAIYNKGTINLAGTIEFASATDTVYNAGTINWDLANDATTTVSGFQYIENAGTLSITVSSEMAETASYVIATGDFSNAGTYATDFTLTGATGTASISVDGSAVEYNGRSYTLSMNDMKTEITLTSGAVSTEHVVNSDIDGNGISDVVFQWVGAAVDPDPLHDYRLGYWMNGTNEWRSDNKALTENWTPIKAKDINSDGEADVVMFGKTSDEQAIIGYYGSGYDKNWTTLGMVSDPDNWEVAVGNVTGHMTSGVENNSIILRSKTIGAITVWEDSDPAQAVTLTGTYGDDWTLVGTADFTNSGKEKIVLSHSGNLYTTDLDNNFEQLTSGWGSAWEVRAIGDFSNDGKDDIVIFHQESGVMVKINDGDGTNWENIGQLDAQDWFVVGAGDYNGDQQDDLLVRQYSTGMLGYYEGADQSKWVELGRGVDMNWSVIA